MDKFDSHADGLATPPQNALEVTPNDGADLPFVTRALNVADAGAVSVVTKGGQTVTLTIAAGIPFPIRAVRVRSTGTSATGIVALF